jgi:hypothetical protein
LDAVTNMIHRQYCSRRARRLAQALKFAQGKNNRFQKKEILPETVTDSRYDSKARDITTADSFCWF